MDFPCLGVAYYPEDWPESEMENDIRKMQEYGISLVRIGEFAWHRMEPKEGEFDFSFFQRVVERLAQANIHVILGTPTATPPAWLTSRYPATLTETENGRRMQHGGRRQCCSNQPEYQRYSLRIVEKMAQAFAETPNVIGWQIDNEIYAWNMGCFCPECQRRFRETLRQQYGTIDQLNEAWNLNLFSQWYDNFEQIPAPRDAWHNPHLKQAWLDFQSESHIEFVRKQAQVLHRYVKVPVGTDTMPFAQMDYQHMTRDLDVVQFNHYNDAENLWQVSFWFNHLRTLKDRPFWNTETATCWNGSVQIDQSLKPDGFCRANSWLPIALGGEANLYWLWRTHWAGHELMHGSVLSACGRPMHMVDELRQLSQEYAKAATFINGTKVAGQCALHFSSHCHNMMVSQPIVPSLDYTNALVEDFYLPLLDCGLCPDVIDASRSLQDYKLLFSPLMMTLEECDLSSRIAAWVENGGTWVVGPLTDVRRLDGVRYPDRPFGMLEQLTGLRWLYSVPDAVGQIQCTWTDGATLQGDRWYELFEAESGEAMASVGSGYSTLIGSAVLLRCRVGKGNVIVLGTFPSRADMQRIIAEACRMASVESYKTEGAVVVAPRQGEAGEGCVVVETSGKPASICLKHPMQDLLSGATLQGQTSVEPYQTLVLRSDAERA